jgi:hypothetical protein
MEGILKSIAEALHLKSAYLFAIVVGCCVESGLPQQAKHHI